MNATVVPEGTPKLISDKDRNDNLLRAISEASRNTRTVFFAQLSLCAYSLVTIFGAKDVVFLAATEKVRLPIVKVVAP